MTKKIKRLGGRLALVAALAALTVVAAASAASAAVSVTPSTGIAWTGEVSVTGNAIPSGTTDVAMVVCNMTATPGTKCDAESGTPSFRSVGEYEEGILIPVRRGPWANYDFTKGTPPKAVEGTTTCYSAELNAGSACAVVVSFYDLSEGFAQLGAQAGSISFK